MFYKSACMNVFPRSHTIVEKQHLVCMQYLDGIREKTKLLLEVMLMCQ